MELPGSCPPSGHLQKKESSNSAGCAVSLSPRPSGRINTIDSRLSSTWLLCPPVTGLCLCVTLSGLRRDNTFPPASQRTHSVMDRDCQEAFNRRLPLQHSAFFTVQLSHPYVIAGKSIVLTIRTFVSKVMSLHSNTLFTFTIALFPRSRCLLISWLLSLSAVILDSRKMCTLMNVLL